MVRKLRSLYLSIIREEKKGLLPSLALSTLSSISCLYYTALKLREFLYRYGVLKSVALPVPVISVGNVTMGGTGKTPFLEFLAKLLLERGRKTAILSRGYAGMKVGDDRVNDEYLEFSERLPDVPVLLGRDRLSSADKALKKYRPDCLLLDDGFQHWRIARNLDIVVIDCLQPFGNGGLIPAGILREPLDGLKRAGLFVLSHTDLCTPEDIRAIRKRLGEADGRIPVLESVHHPLYLEDTRGQRLETTWLSGRRVFAFCGLGNPESFKKTLQAAGADVVRFMDFPDHHHYTADELNVIYGEAAELGVEAVVTTQKDFVKIKRTANSPADKTPVLSLAVEMRITSGLEALSEKIEELV